MIVHFSNDCTCHIIDYIQYHTFLYGWFGNGLFLNWHVWLVRAVLFCSPSQESCWDDHCGVKRVQPTVSTHKAGPSNSLSIRDMIDVIRGKITDLNWRGLTDYFYCVYSFTFIWLPVTASVFHWVVLEALLCCSWFQQFCWESTLLMGLLSDSLLLLPSSIRQLCNNRV